MCLFKHDYEFVEEGSGGYSMDGIVINTGCYFKLYVCTSCGKEKWLRIY